MIGNNGRTPHPATQDDLLQASRAIFDQTKELVRKEVKDFEAGVAVRLSGVVDSRLSESIPNLVGDYLKRVDADYRRKSLELDKSFSDRVKSLQDHYEAKLGALEDEYRQRTEFLQKAFELGMSQLLALVKSMQENPVVVNLPPSLPPEVNVNLPAMQVRVEPPPAIPPEVIVHAPAPRLTRKYFDYDQHGRPLMIDEYEKKELNEE